MTAALQTNWGSPMVVNMPSEEVFTTPDYRQTEGVVRITRPINLNGGGRVEDLTLRFFSEPAVGPIVAADGPGTSIRNRNSSFGHQLSH